MSEYIYKRYNVSILLYHYVCYAKYRRVIFDDSVDRVLVQTCKEISKRYEINIVEIGTDGDHVHFFDTVCSIIIAHNDCKDNKKYYCERNI